MLLNFKSLGSGPPLFILHGLFGTLDNWQTIARKLEDHWSVYLVDQRNHGKSPHTEEMNYSLMADDLFHLMESQGIRHASVMGHSMGGKTAMKFALEYPEMTESLIVADMGVQEYQAGHDLIFEALESVDPGALENRSEAEDKLAELIPDKGVRLFLLKNLSRKKTGKGYRWKMNLPAIRNNYPDILNSVTADYPYDGPAIFIRGGLSDYLKDEEWGNIKQLFPRAELSTIADTGHWLHADAPDEFTAVLRNFLEKNT